MQQPVIMAFRKRMSKRGYTEISIKQLKEDGVKIQGKYIITAREPLALTKVSVIQDICQMNYKMKGKIRC